MNGQTKNRKDRRRFAKLMSLMLSASLMFGNMAVASAGVVEGNPDAILPDNMESPNIENEFGDGELQAGTESNNGALTLVVSPNEMDWYHGKVSVSCSVSGSTSYNVYVSDNTTVEIGSAVSVDSGMISAGDSYKDVYEVSSNDVSKNVIVAVSDRQAYSSIGRVNLAEPDREGIISANINEGTVISVNISGDEVNVSPEASADVIRLLADKPEDQETVSGDDAWEYTWAIDKGVSEGAPVALKIKATSENGYYTGEQEISTNAVVTSVVSDEETQGETKSISTADVKVEVSPSEKIIENEDITTSEWLKENFTVNKLTIDNAEVDLSANENVTVDLSVSDITATASGNVAATVKISENTTVMAGSESYNGSKEMTGVASVKLEGGVNPPQPGVAKSISTADVKVEVLPDVNTISDDNIATDGWLKDNFTVNKLTIDNTEVKLSENANVTVDLSVSDITATASGNVTAIVKISENTTVMIGSQSYNGSKVVTGVATVKLEGGVNPPQPGVAKSISTADVKVEVLPSEKTVSGADLVTAGWLKNNFTINKLTIDNAEVKLSENANVTVELSAKDITKTASGNVTATVKISENTTVMAGTQSYNGTTTAEDAGNYVIAAIDEKDHLTMAYCKVDKAVIKTVEVAAGKLNLKVNIKDGKADVITTNQPTVTKINGKVVPEGLTSKDFTFEWEVPTSPTKGQKIDLVVKAAAGNRYYTGNAKTPIGTINSVTTTKKAQTIKVTPASVSLKQSATKKSKTIKVASAKGTIKATLDKAGEKIVKMSTNKNKTRITVAPKNKKAVGVAKITIKAEATPTYKASKEITVKVTIVPKKKASAKITNIKITPLKKKGQAKVTWKATKKKM